MALPMAVKWTAWFKVTQWTGWYGMCVLFKLSDELIISISKTQDDAVIKCIMVKK